MARILLPFDEMMALQRSQEPLPPEVESISSSGDTLVVRINPRDRLPKFLQRLTPILNVNLKYDRFESGRAVFKVTTALNALPLNALVQLLLKIFSLPTLKGVDLKVAGDDLFVLIDLQTLVGENVRGVTVTDFRLERNIFVLDAEIGEIEVLT